MKAYFKDLEKVIEMENNDYMKLMNKTSLLSQKQGQQLFG